jgi:acetoacetate decarboxylase
MLKGFTTPLTPKGRSSLVPAPPWNNAGVVFAVEYWADPDIVAAFLPPGFALGPDPGYAIANFCEWQSSSAGKAELLDPVRSQYQEFFVILEVTFRGERTFICPFMYVDNDINLYRGLIQGLPKQHASIRMTRSYGVENPSAAGLRAGSRIGATMTHRDRRMVEARMTFERPEDTQTPLGLASSPVLGLRHFPDLAGGAEGRPLVFDIVAFTGSGKTVADVWTGPAELIFHDGGGHELADLAPQRVGRAARYQMGFTISNVRKLADVDG